MQFSKNKLKGKKIAALAGDGFEYVELAIPKKALEAMGADMEVISIHGGKIRGMNITAPTRAVSVDRTLDEVRPEDYDALFIPGGFIGPDFLRQSAEARNFVRAFDAANKPIATLCHGPWLLVSADLVEGRTLASWPGIRDDIVHAGGTWRDEAVVRDGNWVSSRGPQDLADLIPAMSDLYAEGPRSRTSEQATRQHDGASSPQYTQPLRSAVAAARFLPGPALRTVAALAAVAAAGAYGYRRAMS